MQMCFESVLGYITLKEKDGRLTAVTFGKEEGDKGCNVLLKAKRQIEEYISGKRKKFDLPIIFKGTKFQMAIWNYLLTVPYGKTTSYKVAAEYVGCANGARAAGRAIGSNPFAIIVPCHRIVSSNGNITGYRYGVGIKTKLLE